MGSTCARVFAPLLLVAACTTHPERVGDNTANVEASVPRAAVEPPVPSWRSELFGRRWRVVSFTDAQGTVAAREMWLEFGPGGVRGHSFVNGFWHYLRYCSGARLTYGSGARQLLGSTPDEEALDGRFFTAVSMIRRYARNNDSLELRSEDGYIVVRLDSDAPSVAPTQALARPRSADDDNPTSYPYPPPPCP